VGPDAWAWSVHDRGDADLETVAGRGPGVAGPAPLTREGAFRAPFAAALASERRRGLDWLSEDGRRTLSVHHLPADSVTGIFQYDTTFAQLVADPVSRREVPSPPRVLSLGDQTPDGGVERHPVHCQHVQVSVNVIEQAKQGLMCGGPNPPRVESCIRLTNQLENATQALG